MPDPQHKPLQVFIVDSVGAHRGMHYYNFALVSALNQIGADAVLISTSQTASHSLRPDNVPVRGAFEGIYGDRSIWLRGLRYALALLRMGWWAWRERPRVAHFHFFQVPLLDYMLLRWLNVLGIKTIITVHDVLPFELGTDFAGARGKIHHRLYASASGLILHSSHTRECLAELDPHLVAKSVLIPHGNYSGVIQRHPIGDAKIRIGLGPEVRVVLVFGSIRPNKRVDLVIEAMVEVSRACPDTKLVVAGKPQDQDVSEYVALAKRLGIAANIVWRLGYVTDEELMWYYSAADVIVVPYQWIYQSGALLMAMNFGKPVVATAVGSCTDVIKDHETGLLVPLDDPAAMANAIQTILKDRQLAMEIGRAAREFVTTELSWDAIASSTFAFYRRDLSGKQYSVRST